VGTSGGDIAAQVFFFVPWVSDYRRWLVYNRIPYQVKERAGNPGITAENMEKSQHIDFNKNKTN